MKERRFRGGVNTGVAELWTSSDCCPAALPSPPPRRNFTFSINKAHQSCPSSYPRPPRVPRAPPSSPSPLSRRPCAWPKLPLGPGDLPPPALRSDPRTQRALRLVNPQLKARLWPLTQFNHSAQCCVRAEAPRQSRDRLESIDPSAPPAAPPRPPAPAHPVHTLWSLLRGLTRVRTSRWGRDKQTLPLAAARWMHTWTKGGGILTGGAGAWKKKGHDL